MPEKQPTPGDGRHAPEPDRKQSDRLAEFGELIEELHRDGLIDLDRSDRITTPWAEIPEKDKLWAVVWQSWTSAVPGAAVLAAIEREVDYDRLPVAQREMLLELRAKLDAGHLDGPQPDHNDLAGTALARIVGVGQFDRRLGAWKESDEWSWGELAEDSKVRWMVDLAQEVSPPGAYALAAIERDVDYDKLPSWRREALEGLRARLEAGELDGENPNPPYQGDRAEYALRLAMLDAGVEDHKRFGILDNNGESGAWQELNEEQKFDRIMWDIRKLGLESEPTAYRVIGREVDLTRVAGAHIADTQAQYQSPPDSIALAREVMRDIKEALTRNADGKFPAKYADVDWDGMNLPDPETAWQDMDVGERYDLLRHALDETIWSLVPSARWTEPSDSQKLANEFVTDEVRELHAEWRHDYGLRFLEDRGVLYEDETERALDHAAGGMTELPPRMQRLSPLAEREKHAIAAFDASVAEITQDRSADESGIASAWHTGSDPDRLGILADQGVKFHMEEEVFVRTARRVLGWREPTVEQQGWMADAWTRAESRGLPSPADLTERTGPVSHKQSRQQTKGHGISM
jgi:hypothetical protein